MTRYPPNRRPSAPTALAEKCDCPHHKNPAVKCNPPCCGLKAVPTPANDELCRAVAKADRDKLEDALAAQIKMARLPAPTRQYKAALAATGKRWRWDFAWPDHGVLAEVDGGTYSDGAHVRGLGVENDSLKQSNAAALGWRTLRFTEKMVTSGEALRLLTVALNETKPGTWVLGDALNVRGADGKRISGTVRLEYRSC